MDHQCVTKAALRNCDLHIGNLSPFAPDDLAACGDKSQFGDIHLNNGTLSEDTKLSVKRVLGILLDGENGQLHSDAQFRTERYRIAISTIS